MRTVRLAQRFNRLQATLGLVLSICLILGANRLAVSDAAEPPPGSAPQCPGQIEPGDSAERPPDESYRL